MRKLLNGLVIFSLAFNTSCGQQDGKVAEGAVDADTVIVNRVTEIEDNDGNKGQRGEIGLVHGAKSVSQLNEVVDADEVTWLDADEVRNNPDALQLVQIEGSETEETIAPLVAAGIGLFLGAWIGSASAYNRGCCYYNGYWGGNSVAYQTTYVQPAPVVVQPAPVVTTTVVRSYRTVAAPCYNRYYW